MGGGKEHQEVRGHREAYGHVHCRNEDFKAKTLGVCGQVILTGAGRL